MILETILGGGVTGLLGSFVKHGVEIYGKSQERKFELKKMELGWTFEQKKAEFEMEMKREENATKRYEASVKDSTTRTSKESDPNFMKYPDVVKQYVRPAITLLAMLWLPAMYFTVDPKYQEWIVLASLYIAVTAILWWFGDRANNLMRRLFK